MREVIDELGGGTRYPVKVFQVGGPLGGLVSGDFARIFSTRGITTMKIKVTDVVKPGVIYTTFHFPETAINFLTSGIGDEFTLTPEYKIVAVDFEKLLYGIFSPCRMQI